MNRHRAWARRLLVTLGALVALAMLGAGGLWLASERVLQQRYDVPLTAVTVPNDPASIKEGERLSRIHGCTASCHGRVGLEGRIFVDDPWYGRLVAPNLTAIARAYSDAELTRAIRHGVRRDGTGLFAMPSDMLAQLDDDDLGRIIAYLRATPPVASTLPATRFGPLARWVLLFGNDLEMRPVADRIDHSLPPPMKPDPTNRRGTGRYLALNSCSECHGQDLRGIQAGDFFSPPLLVVAGYSRGEFANLLRTGTPRDGRQLGLMGIVARQRFFHFTDAEIDAVYAYLSSLASGQDNEPAFSPDPA